MFVWYKHEGQHESTLKVLSFANQDGDREELLDCVCCYIYCPGLCALDMGSLNLKMANVRKRVMLVQCKDYRYVNVHIYIYNYA